MRTKTIKQSVVFKAPPHEIYEMLTDPKKHSKFTESKVRMSIRVGGSFTIPGYDIYGKNLKLVKDRAIIWKWQCWLPDWPKNHFSKVIISLKKAGKGTRLSLIHSSVPSSCAPMIQRGWRDFYWNRMHKFLKK